MNKASKVRITKNLARSRNHYCRKETIRITCSECVYVDSVIKHAKRMRRIILSSAANQSLSDFSTLFLVSDMIFR